jgi:hypothetical protein
MAGHFALGLAQAFCEALDFTEVGGEKGEDAIRLSQLRLFNDDGFRLILAWV